eukprot:TRINITY_DN3646_c0_g1_i2.p2 TRINITY_DN3646_c0_g1~~TRINITY_DN3646_c0_g1_i2.p2  ORF type:complete len:142 (+),score=14.87 TRINITY_DN3646_c0_g1_i2:1023-1448(+)
MDGHKYTGSFERSKFHGNGKMKHGMGTYKSTDSYIRSYEGEWRDDMRHGNGKIIFSGGDVLEGSFEFGQPHGRVTITLQASDTELRGQMSSGNWVGNVEIKKIRWGSSSYKVCSETGLLSVHGSEYCQYLLPPFLPLFQYQ